MCGIIGGFDIPQIEKGLQSIIHRGPDDEGIFIEEGDSYSIALGMRRLSIIDLSDEANQPFSDLDNRFKLVFNGEIYNYLELKNELNFNFKSY